MTATSSSAPAELERVWHPAGRPAVTIRALQPADIELELDFVQRLSPQTLYECVGDVPNVAFPCAALTDAATGRIALYYGCADTVTGLAFCQVDEVIDYVKSNSAV